MLSLSAIFLAKLSGSRTNSLPSACLVQVRTKTFSWIFAFFQRRYLQVSRHLHSSTSTAVLFAVKETINVLIDEISLKAAPFQTILIFLSTAVKCYFDIIFLL